MERGPLWPPAVPYLQLRQDEHGDISTNGIPVPQTGFPQGAPHRSTPPPSLRETHPRFVRLMRIGADKSAVGAIHRPLHLFHTPIYMVIIDRK